MVNCLGTVAELTNTELRPIRQDGVIDSVRFFSWAPEFEASFAGYARPKAQKAMPIDGHLPGMHEFEVGNG